jgi:hypothetical protein
MRKSSGICEGWAFSSQPIAAAECMPAHGIGGEIACEMTVLDVSVRECAHFPCNCLRMRFPTATGHSGASNFLSWLAGHFGLAFYGDHALQIPNEA